MRKRTSLVALAAATTLLLPASPSLATDKQPDDQASKVLATGLVSPLHVAVSPDGSVFVSQDFAAKLSLINHNGTVDNVYTGKPGWDVAGVSTRDSLTYFLESTGAGEGQPEKLSGYLKVINRNGDIREIANFADYERENNPDGDQEYGLGPEASAACVAEVTPKPGEAGPPPRYQGTVDSHPYALALEGSTAYVADAGMNAILSVDLRSGDIETVAVLPPRPVTITRDAAQALNAPNCEGATYAFEPVPTDVEVAPDGRLFISSLPGGPEDPSLGARGAIFRVNPWNGRTKVWAEGILSPTGLAVSDDGDVYVASLFGGKILKFNGWNKARSDFLKVNQPADVEVDGNMLYATGDGLSGAPAGPGAPPPAGPFTGKVIKAGIR
ncbi:ScyD/ScyE family protein [Pseudarthrobacter enclensis]|uniref:ScyD/ScyE family protein n=1 Tax=Pseudarthrobacter enclensis TaxID=993070 RepID=UPI003430E5AB